jgi:hypothetical protein
LLLLVISCQAWAVGLADLTDKDASGGLREALVQGASKAVGQLGTDGGFLNNPKVKIGLPATLAPVEACCAPWAAARTSTPSSTP